jgi:hypothetical protein
MINLAPEPGVPHPFDAFARRLLQADWKSTAGPMRFSASLTLSDLADAAFLHNTRVLMAGLAVEQGTPATATGNLTRAFVGSLFDHLTLSSPSRQSIRTVCNPPRVPLAVLRARRIASTPVPSAIVRGVCRLNRVNPLVRRRRRPVCNQKLARHFANRRQS